MRLVVLLFVISFSAYANELNWSLENMNDFKKYNQKSVKIEGQLKYFKKYIRARDNFYKLKIYGPDHNRYVEVKLYTIKWLKRVNYFNCKEGQQIKLQGILNVKPKKERIGTMNITKNARILSCE